MKSIGISLVLIAGLIAVAQQAQANDKVTICHAAGRAGTTHYVTLTLDSHAVFGPAGHFLEPGTTAAGHEEDYMGPCREGDLATATVPPVTATATTAPTSPTFTATPTPTNTPAPPLTLAPTSTPVAATSSISRPAATPSVLPRSLPVTGSGGYLD